jgi:hypothetical protein
MFALSQGWAVWTFADTYKYTPSSPLHLGGGFDPLNSDLGFVPCLMFETKALDSGTRSTRYKASRIKNHKELYEHLGLDVSLSATSSFVSGSGSFSLETDYTFSSDDYVWTLEGESDYGRYGLGGPRLTQEAAQLTGNPWAFVSRCGFEFVAQERRAVRATAVFSLHNVSSSEKAKLRTALSDSGRWPGGSTSVSSALDKFKSSLATTSTVRVDVFAIGGQGITKLASLTTVDDPDAVRKIIQAYIDGLTPEAAPAIEFTTGRWDAFGVNVVSAGLDQRRMVLSELFFAFNDSFTLLRDLGQIIRRWGKGETQLTLGEAAILIQAYNDSAGVLGEITGRAAACFQEVEVLRNPLQRPGKETPSVLIKPSMRIAMFNPQLMAVEPTTRPVPTIFPPLPSRNTHGVPSALLDKVPAEVNYGPILQSLGIQQWTLGPTPWCGGGSPSCPGLGAATCTLIGLPVAYVDWPERQTCHAAVYSDPADGAVSFSRNVMQPTGFTVFQDPTPGPELKHKVTLPDNAKLESVTGVDVPNTGGCPWFHLCPDQGKCNVAAPWEQDGNSVTVYGWTNSGDTCLLTLKYRFRAMKEDSYCTNRY